MIAVRAFGAVGQSVEEIDFALAAGGRLEGTVLLADGVTPVPGARVESFALGPFGTFGLDPVVADAGGNWFVDGLESRSYKIRASAPGLVSEVYPNAVCSMSCDVFNAGDPIAVSAGATTSDIDVALAAGIAVSGTVTDLAAVPLAGVSVSVHASPGGGSVYTQTSANGAWVTPEGLLPGTYFARTGSDYLDELWNDLDGDEWQQLLASDQFHSQLTLLLHKIRITERNLQQYKQTLSDLNLELV